MRQTNQKVLTKRSQGERGDLRLSSRLHRLLSSAFAAVLVSVALTVAPGTPASAVTAPEFNYSVSYGGSGGILDVPGTQLTFSMMAGEAIYLSTRDLSAAVLTPLRGGGNPGTTFLLTCTGPGLSGTGVQRGVYAAKNADTPGVTTTAEWLRWLLVAPTTGTYTCRVQVSSYARNDTIDYAGGSLSMRVNSGAQLIYSTVGGANSVIKAANRWAMPDVARSNEFVLWNGSLRIDGSNAVLKEGANALTLVQDVNLTTCIAGDSATWAKCAGTSAGGSTIKTWIEAQPQYADGASCGPLITGPVRSTWIEPDVHHRTVNDTLVIDRSQIGAGCDRVRTSLMVSHGGGAPAVVHSHWAGQDAANAPTHGVAYQH
jgi:hypothetical protein